MSKQSMLTAIRRGLKRGALPPDQQAMLRGRLASHPRHLIPARSRLPHGEQVSLFISNVEKEFGTVTQVADLDAVPGAVVDYLAAQNLPGRVVMAPHPELQAIPWAARPLLHLREGRAEIILKALHPRRHMRIVMLIGRCQITRRSIGIAGDEHVVPEGLDDPAAATSYINPLTAWALTRSSHNLKEGDWLLQTAAASSVGKLVLQLAQQYRFKTINVIRRREQETIIRNLGGNEVICTADEDLTARLQELTAGKGVERAIDCVAGELGAEIARNLAPAGTMLVYGALSSHRQTDPAKFLMPLFAPRLIYSTGTVRGWWLPRWVPSQLLAEVRAATGNLLTMFSNGVLTAAANSRYPLKDFQEAVRLADGEAGQGKVLLDFSN